jgi:two-component system sensor histidine kinase MprB
VALLAAYFAVRTQLDAQIDNALQQRAATFAAHTARRARSSGDRTRVPAAKIGEAPGYIQFVTAAGKVTLLPGESSRLPAAGAAAVARGARGPFFTDAHVAGTDVRIYTRRAGTSAVQVALSVSGTEHVLFWIRLLFAAISTLAVALAAVAALFITRAALRPVERLTAEAERIAATRELRAVTDDRRDDEIGRLARSFNTMLSALADSVTAQRQLVADASHELRTPLTTARTNLESVGLHPEMSSGARERSIDAAVVELEEMTRLIDDLVELARGDVQPSAYEDVRFDAVVQEAVELARRRSGRPFQLVAEPTLVRGDAGELGRAVSNLLDNAVKWSPPAAPIEVTVGHGACVVRDHGPGIDPVDLPHVFDRFYRAAGSRSLPGSGLGLAIVRQVAEAHGGAAAAEPAPGGGTNMTIRLPLDG